MSKRKLVCVVGVIFCFALASFFLPFIQSDLIVLDFSSLLVSMYFWFFVDSAVACVVFGALFIHNDRRNANVKSGKNITVDAESDEKVSVSNVLSSVVGQVGASGYATLLPGSKIMTKNGDSFELGEEALLWPKYAPEVPTEPPLIETKERKFFKPCVAQN